MGEKPFTVQIIHPDIIPDHYDNHILRNLSSMKGIYFDQQSYAEMLTHQDCLVYEVYEFNQPTGQGEMISGLSIVHPGMVGQEYNMTKGHFHEVIETAEVYFCLKGHGMMVMETPEGEWSATELKPGSVLYVPPRWAHRSVNTDSHEDLVTFFVYPAYAGHNYKTIESTGFRKMVVNRGNGPEIIDNPRWVSNRGEYSGA